LPRRCRRRIGWVPFYRSLSPVPPSGRGAIFLTVEEVEALRLVDFLGLTQEEAGERMGVSRGSVWRALSSARRKVAQAIVEGREIVIVPG